MICSSGNNSDITNYSLLDALIAGIVRLPARCMLSLDLEWIDPLVTAENLKKIPTF